MKRSQTRWITAVAASALLTLPLGALAQTPPTQPKPTSSPQASQPADTPQDHLRQAEAALSDISPTAVTGDAKKQINELKQKLNSLQRSAGANDKASATGAENKSAKATSGKDAQWSKDVAAIDKILNQLLGSGSAAGATPAPAGTSGSASKGAPAATIDEATRSKLMEVQKHVTAFASAMGKSPSPSDEPSAASPQPSTAPAQPPTSSTQPPATSAQPPATSTQPPPASSQPPTTTSQPPSTPSQPPSTTSQPPSTPSQPPSTTSQPPTSATEPPAAASQPQASAAGQADQDEAKKHLTASRESLSQLTQLPAASQLQGEARTQVSQLITNFNELITTGSNWRASYAKVEANVNALIGAQSSDEAPTPTPATGTPGAVGTSGTASSGIDPAIKAKLVEFRNHLKEFEKAAGGAGAGSAEPSSSAAASPMTAASASPTSSSSASPTGAAASAAGSASATATPSEPAKEPSSSMSKDDAMKHIQAIEAMLSANATGSAGATATAGTTGTSAAAAGLVLDKAQVEQMKTHLAELRRLIAQKQ